MITATSTVRGDHGRVRGVTEARCPACGETTALLDLGRGDRIDHRCGTPVMGGTWWIDKAAPRTARRRRQAS